MGGGETSEPERCSYLSAHSLSQPAAAMLPAAGTDGRGVLSTVRPWVRREGWLLKEGGIANSYHLRYFAVAADFMLYFKEESLKLRLEEEYAAAPHTPPHQLTRRVHARCACAAARHAHTLVLD
eukprot:scaffold192564_cov35-Tisochrysis_lutea.AAC.2